MSDPTNMADLPDNSQVSQALRAAQAGDQDAMDRLLSLVYAELHRLARARMARLPYTLRPGGGRLAGRGVGSGPFLCQVAVFQVQNPIREGEDTVVVRHRHQGDTALAGQTRQQRHDRLAIFGV